VGTTSSGGSNVGWPSRLSKARLHFVTGKGGTGKSTVAAALALTLASGGRKVLLVEVEGRQGIAQLFDVPPLPYKELKIATAEHGGQVNALAIDIEAAFLEYLDMFYNLGIAGKAMRRVGAIEFATTIAPGLRDVLLTGKIKESVIRTEKGTKNPVYDAIVVDAPPTGRIARFLDVTRAVSDLAKGGPVYSQAEGVVKILHSDQTAIHLVTLLEALPMQETKEAIDELQELGLPIGSVIVNQNIPVYLQPDDLAKAADGDVDREVKLPGGDLEVVAHRAVRGRHQAANRRVVAGPQRRDGVKHALVLRDDVPGAAEGLLVELGAGREQPRDGHVAQCPHAEVAGGPLAGRPPRRVPAGDVLVLDLGVDDEHGEPGRVEPEVDR